MEANLLSINILMDIHKNDGNQEKIGAKREDSFSYWNPETLSTNMERLKYL